MRNLKCPNCTSQLKKNKKHAAGVFKCPSCEGLFFILITTEPKNNFMSNNKIKTNGT